MILIALENINNNSLLIIFPISKATVIKKQLLWLLFSNYDLYSDGQIKICFAESFMKAHWEQFDTELEKQKKV